ncbi:DUF885 family protein [Phenylobacterium sp. J426]|uniref:DUF885 domain-containing protein n=1 Tax=Phenylobacterium sp. J426 TaxID=2898439 RepID=UPI002150DC9B|nr:DUF885 family protein [Phenylobacterium sp. J426]MCR5874933.1 DUF885 family protein [Phenylobacterium sp. J426]
MTTQFDRRSFLATTAGAALAAATPALAQGGAQGSEDARLRAQLDAMFETLVDDSPEFATRLGLDKDRRAGLKAQLDDESLAARDRRLQRTRDWVRQLRTIDRAKLSQGAKIDYDTVLYVQEQAVYSGDRYKFGSVGRNYSPFVVSQRTGSYQDIPDFLDSQHKVANASDAEANLSRISAFARQMDQDLERLNHDVALGAVLPAFAVPLAIGQMRALREQPAAQTVLVTSLARKTQAANLPGDWAARAEKIVQTEVFPALDRQIAAMEALKAKARPDAGAWALPNGEAYYADAVKSSTTTDYTPDQVHRMGLDQVREITAQIDAILKSQGMTQGSVGQRLAALNNDPKQLYPDTDEGRAQIIADLNQQIAAIYKDLPKAFRTMPKAPVEVRRVPAFIQDGASNGYYQAPALDGSRPGAFYINLKTTADWPRYNLPTLTYHEAAPGHHMQIAIAQENPSIPILRRTGFGNSAYSEGWALYAEQVADEMGVYANDPLGRAGYLQSLLFRAARLVVDTGIHAKRWTRAQATQYMVDVIGYPETRAQREVERYFVSPGQACTYKIGHVVWVKLREDARRKLGSRFQIADFHDAALLYGNMPMTVLERHIADWAAARA